MHYTKVQPPPRQRQRVRELAKDVGCTVSEVRDVLASIGEYVANDFSFVEAPVIRRVYEALGVREALPPPAQPPTAPAPPAGLSPPRVRSRRENNPLMDLPSVQRQSERNQRQAGAPVGQGKSRETSWTKRSGGDGFAALSDAAPVWEYESWKLHRFTEVERDAWLSEGLRPWQAKMASDLRDAGLAPSDLGVVVSGWSVAARLAKGEGAPAVARLLRRQQQDYSA